MANQQRRGLRVRFLNDWAEADRRGGDWNVRLVEISQYRTMFWPLGRERPLRGVEIVLLGFGLQLHW